MADTRRNQPEKRKDNYRTPNDVYDSIFRSLGVVFTLDVAADDDNALCNRYWTLEENALKQSWETGGMWWCNPPFVMVEDFLKKAEKEFEKGNEGIMLVPSNQETKWYRENITHKNRPTLVWPRRISFIDPAIEQPASGNVIGSVLVAFTDVSNLNPIEGEPWRVNTTILKN